MQSATIQSVGYQNGLHNSSTKKLLHANGYKYHTVRIQIPGILNFKIGEPWFFSLRIYCYLTDMQTVTKIKEKRKKKRAGETRENHLVWAAGAEINYIRHENATEIFQFPVGWVLSQWKMIKIKSLLLNYVRESRTCVTTLDIHSNPLHSHPPLPALISLKHRPFFSEKQILWHRSIS